MKIPFNRPCFVGDEIKNVQKALRLGKLSGDGFFTQKVHALLEKKYQAHKVLLTPSGTDALELAALLINISQGDEVILPTYTFTSTANAFLLRGAKPVFVDIRPDTLNLDEKKIEEKLTKHTKAIVPVHYGGIGCEMGKIMQIAEKNRLVVVEDAAQAIDAKYHGQYLGTIAPLGCLSFHETKNIMSGEGGALIINQKSFVKRAEILREKGTDRSQFSRGKVKKYRWLDVGSSFLPSDAIAAILYAQLKSAKKIKQHRERIFKNYLAALKKIAECGHVRLPIIPQGAVSNYHIFFLILNDKHVREKLTEYLMAKGILSVRHYVPLHSAPMGQKFGYKRGDFPIAEDLSERLLRLPLYNNMTPNEQDYVIKNVQSFFK